jgi:histone-lysine N-methyltransferase SETMAR
LSLLSSHRNFNWLDNLITGDEKWVMYDNRSPKRQWLDPGDPGQPISNVDRQGKKVLLSIWWGVKGVVHWELLPAGHTIDAHVYCEQLDRVKEKLRGKQDRVYFLHDNARPHVAFVTQQKLLSFNWVLLSHPPYSPDLAPSDYHLFLSLASQLEGQKFTEEDQLRTDLEEFFSQKTEDFYRRGIYSLPKRWQSVVENSGSYVVKKKLFHCAENKK